MENFDGYVRYGLLDVTATGATIKINGMALANYEAFGTTYLIPCGAFVEVAKQSNCKVTLFADSSHSAVVTDDDISFHMLQYAKVENA